MWFRGVPFKIHIFMWCIQPTCYIDPMWLQLHWANVALALAAVKPWEDGGDLPREIARMQTCELWITWLRLLALLEESNGQVEMRWPPIHERRSNEVPWQLVQLRNSQSSQEFSIFGIRNSSIVQFAKVNVSIYLTSLKGMEEARERLTVHAMISITWLLGQNWPWWREFFKYRMLSWGCCVSLHLWSRCLKMLCRVSQ